MRTRFFLAHTHTHTSTHTYCAVVVPTQRSGQDPTNSSPYLRTFLLQTFLLSLLPRKRRQTPPTTTCQSFQVPFTFPGFLAPPDVIHERSSKPESVTPPENESLQQQSTYVSIHLPLEVVSRSIDLHNTHTYIPIDLLDWKEKSGGG